MPSKLVNSDAPGENPAVCSTIDDQNLQISQNNSPLAPTVVPYAQQATAAGYFSANKGATYKYDKLSSIESGTAFEQQPYLSVVNESLEPNTHFGSENCYQTFGVTSLYSNPFESSSSSGSLKGFFKRLAFLELSFAAKMRLTQISTLIFFFTFIYLLLADNAVTLDNFLTTSTCTLPDGSKTVLSSSFAIVMDAGSTGTRFHLYKFQTCGGRITKVLNETFLEVKPGLSHYKDEPEMAAQSIIKLIRRGSRTLPLHLRRFVPIVIKATAGLRLLKPVEADGIINAVRKAVKKTVVKDLGFKPIPDDAIGIIDGQEEGIEGWKTINFLYGLLKPYPDPNVTTPTKAVIDLGGGSMQVVFEVGSDSATKHVNNQRSKLASYFSQVNFYDTTKFLYHHSYLGAGINEAKKRYSALNVDHCSIKGEKGWESCYKSVQSIVNLKEKCNFDSCSFDGTFQPQISSNVEFVLFSYFYDRIQEAGLPTKMTIKHIKEALEQHCYQPSPTKSAAWCFDTTYIYVILKDGLGLTEDHTLNFVKKFNDIEVCWSLGSALSLLSSNTGAQSKTNLPVSPVKRRSPKDALSHPQENTLKSHRLALNVARGQ